MKEIGIQAIYWIVVISLWSVIWKGIALWNAARNGQRNWFIALLIVNTAGILEILYLNLWQRKVS